LWRHVAAVYSMFWRHSKCTRQHVINDKDDYDDAAVAAAAAAAGGGHDDDDDDDIIMMTTITNCLVSWRAAQCTVIT